MNFGSIALTWDLFILLFPAILVIYSILLGRNKIVGLLVNFYISLAVVMVAGETIYGWVSNFGFISSRLAVSEFAVKTILIFFLTVALSIKSEIAGLDSAGSVSKFQAGIYGFLASGLILSTVFNFMSDANRVALDSNFANIVSGYFVFWALLPILMMVLSSFIKKI